MGMVLQMIQIPSNRLAAYIDKSKSFTEDYEFLEQNKDGQVYLDKSWEGLHYILTGNNIGEGEKPLSLAIYSEQHFDENEDLGYGPASYLTAAQVSEISFLLTKIDDTEFKKRFDSKKMDSMGIYPEFWDSNPIDTFEYLIDNFRKLRNFYKKSATTDCGIVSYIS